MSFSVRLSFALLALVLVCFGHACSADFIKLDDNLFVTENPHVKGGLSWSGVRWAFTDSCLWAGYWIPLIWLSLQFDATLFGPEGAWGFHLVNILLHAANALLLYFLLQRMTGARWRSALAAALFAVHPLRVESVAWITERKDTLSTLLLLAIIATYVFYARHATWSRYALLLGAFAVGMMSKPSLVTLPCVFLLLDYWPLARLRWGQEKPQTAQEIAPSSLMRLVVEKAPLFAMSLINGLVTLRFARETGALSTVDQVSLSERMTVALSGYLSYLQKTVWPTDLAVFYPYAPPDGLRVILALVVLGGISLLAIRLRKAQPALLVGWLWFLGTLLPVSGVLQIGGQAFADRYAYVPHMGLFLGVVWTGANLLEKWPWSSVIPIVGVGAWLLALAGMTWVQVSYWHDSERLFLRTLEVTQKNWHIHMALGDHYLRTGRLEEAAEQMAAACQIRPDYPDARLGLGLVLTHLDKHDMASVQLQEVLRHKPKNGEALFLLGINYANLGKLADAKRSLQLALNAPAERIMEDVPTRRAGIAHQLAEIALREGDLDSARDYARQAVQWNPTFAPARHILGVVYARLKQWDNAEAEFHLALGADVNYHLARGYLAHAYAVLGKGSLSKAEYAYLQASPEWAKRLRALVIEFVTKSTKLDVATAQELALQLCEATNYRDAYSLDALAAVAAARGDFATARSLAKQAFELAATPPLRDQIQNKLGRYQKNLPLPLEDGSSPAK